MKSQANKNGAKASSEKESKVVGTVVARSNSDKVMPVEKGKNARTLRNLVDDFANHKKKTGLVQFKKDGSEPVTFGKLLLNCTRIAAGLHQVGLKKGDRVMLMAGNSPEWIFAYLATVYAGGVALPVDGQQSDEVLKHIIADSKPKFVFTDSNGNDVLHRLFHRKPFRVFRLDMDNEPKSWKNLINTEDKLPELEISPDDDACIFYTSGTTGMPKGVPLTHANIIMQLDSAIADSDLLNKSDRVLLPLPLFHVYPLNMGLLGPLRMGLPVLLPQSVTGPELMRALKMGKATVLVAVPRLLRSMLNGIESKLESKFAKMGFNALLNASGLLHRATGVNVGKTLFAKVHKELSPSLRLLCSGGALLEEELANKLSGLGWGIAVGYGLTETAPLLTMRLPDDTNFATAGKPISGVELRITHYPDPNQEAENEGQHNEGEIEVRGPNVFSGYLNLDDVTAEAFTSDGWFKTGDVGHLDASGRLHINGRASSLIVMEGGKKVQPDEIEKVYGEHPSIKEIGVLQVDNKLVALVMPAKSTDDQSAISAALAAASSKLPSYKRVRGFALTKQPLPKTNLGKLKRKELEELYKGIKSGKVKDDTRSGGEEQLSAEDSGLMENEVAEQVMSWLKERFPEHHIGMDTSPALDLNVDSFEWLNLSLELSETTGVELDDETIASISTVRDLITKVVEAKEQGGEKKASPMEEPEKYLSKEQKHWLSPLSKSEQSMADSLFFFNLWLMKTFFHSSAVGLDKLDKNKQYVFNPNHASYLDIFALCSALPQDVLNKTQVAAWSGIAFHNPFNTFMSRLVHAFPIEAKKSLISSLALGAGVLKKGSSLIWFPEGERTLDGKLLKFKPGIGMLLEKFEDVEVVPVYLDGTREALPPGALWPKFEKITVVFGDPISPRELLKEGEGKTSAEQIANAIHDEVAALKPNSRQREKFRRMEAEDRASVESPAAEDKMELETRKDRTNGRSKKAS